jgi:hypothetical protein
MGWTACSPSGVSAQVSLDDRAQIGRVERLLDAFLGVNRQELLGGGREWADDVAVLTMSLLTMC